jgi:membrane associated rhomboid family serine protease
MRPASVGFQCPQCVDEGRRSQPDPRTAFGGRIHARDSVVTMTLIGINVAMFVVVSALGRTGDLLVLDLSMVSGEAQLRGLPSGSGVAEGEFWRILTSSFVHTGLTHLLFNMLAIGLIGTNLERVLGRSRYLALFLVSCLTAGTAVYWLSPPAAVTYGASGGVFGLLAAALVVYRKQGYDVRALLVLLAINLFFTFTVPNISWQGHIGGLVGGLVAAAALACAPRERRTTLQVLAFAGLTALCLVLIALRTVVLSP